MVHVGGFDCSFMNMEYQSEKNMGHQLILTFKCKMCNIENKIYPEKPKTEKCPINKATVHACQAIGIGYTQLSELMAFFEIPIVSETS